MSIAHPSRRRLLAWGAYAWPLATAAGGLAVTFRAHAETALPSPSSLPAAATAALAHHQPLVLLVSLPGCPYCERVRRSQLLPLSRESDNAVVQIDLGSAASVQDFDGVTRSQDAVAQRFNARFAPTVCSWDRKARSLPSVSSAPAFLTSTAPSSNSG